jgi:LuxR family transcriptional regulator, maltose regulon positive regulatory protein
MTAMIGDSSFRGHGKGKHPARSAGERTSSEICDICVRRRLAQAGQPGAAALTSLLDDPRPDRVWLVAAFLLGAIARDMLGGPEAAEHAGGTVAGQTADLLAGADGPAPPRTPARRLEALTHGETRVLHYLPTNLSAPEIAGELYLSVNTVKTHQRHLYQKLGARSRTQAVEQARALGLIASSSRRR